jgi:hypothetical protein
MERLDPMAVVHASGQFEFMIISTFREFSKRGSSRPYADYRPRWWCIGPHARYSPAGFDLRIRVIFLLGGDFMKIQASFVQDGKWWVAWTDDVPGALTQGATLDEARENLIDAVRMMRQPVDLSKLPRNKIVIEQLEV